MNLETLFPALCELLLKSAAVLLLAAAVDVCWRGASAASRHMIWTVALATLLALPLTRLAAPFWVVEMPPVTRVAVPPPAPIPATSTVSAPETSVLGAARSPGLPPWRALLVFAWLAGAAGILGHQLGGQLLVRRLRRRAAPVTDARVQSLARAIAAGCGVSDGIELRHSPECGVPLAWGLRRPVILLPDPALAWPERRLAAALRHEFGHVRRRDCLTRSVARLACAFYWVNPLVWLAARRLRLVQEQACDDLVLRGGANAPDYAALLVEAVRALDGRRLATRHGMAMAQPSTLETRVRAILDARRNRGALSRGATVAGVATAGALVAASASAQVRAHPDPKAPRIEIEARLAPAFTASGTRGSGTSRTLLRADRAANSPQPGPAAAPADAAQRASKIVIPHAEFQGAPLNDAIELLRQQALKSARDPRHTVNIVLMPDAKRDAKVSLNLREVSLADALRYLAQLTGNVLVWTTDTALIGKPGMLDRSTRRPDVSSSRAVRKASEIVIPHIEFVEAPLPAVLDFFMAESRKLDPRKAGVNIILRLAGASPPAVTLSLRNATLLDALQYVAQVTGLELVTAANALRLESKGAGRQP